MARIRTIKPEFWTDDAITECSTSARLLFIGMWNFSDDNGNIDRSAKQLKMKIFPADNIDAEPLLQELLAQNLVIEYQANGCLFLHIRGFAKHQKVDKPSKFSLPLYPDSLRTQRVVSEDSTSSQRGLATESKVKEGKGIVKEEAAGITSEGYLNEETAKGVVEEKREPERVPVLVLVGDQERMPVSEALDLSRKSLGRLMETPGQVTILQDICRLYPPERIREAFEAAKSAAVQNLNWVMKRLEARGRESPRMTRDDERRERNHEAAREFCAEVEG